MTDRIIFTAIPSRPGVARVCADECRIKLYDLSTQTLRTDQITVRSAYQIFQKNTRTGDDKISFDTFHHLMDDMFRKYGTATGGKTHLYRRVVQKLYQAVDVSNEGSLTPIQLTCGMSLLFRPEAGISGVDIDSTSPIVEDCLRILCPDGIVTFEKLNEYFTLLFSVFISMSPDLSKVFPAAAAEEEEDVIVEKEKNKEGRCAKELSRLFCMNATRQIANMFRDIEVDSIPVSHFSTWFRKAPRPPQVDRNTAMQIKDSLVTVPSASSSSSSLPSSDGISNTKQSSVKQWIDYDVSPAKCTPHVLQPSTYHTSAPFGLDDQPPSKEPLAFDRVYDTRFDGKDTQSNVVLGTYGTEKSSTPIQQKKMLPPNSPQEVKHMRNEMYHAVRDYVRGSISSRTLRNRLAVLNIKISVDCDRLLSRSERNGSCSFREIVTCLEPCIPQVTFEPPKPRSGSDNSSAPVGILRDRYGHGDVLTWRNENKDSPPPSQRHISDQKALKSSDGLLTWVEADDVDDSTSQQSSSSSVQHPWTRKEKWPARGRMHVSPTSNRTVGCPFGTSLSLSLSLSLFLSPIKCQQQLCLWLGTSVDENVKTKHVGGRRRYSNAPGFTDHIVFSNIPPPSSGRRRGAVRRDQRSHLGHAAAQAIFQSPLPGRGVRKFGRGHHADAWTDHIAAEERRQ